jgi:hypothetical protein
VVFAGIELGSLIRNGSLVPGARAAGGVLWLAGPYGTLYAIAADGIASVGSRTRSLTQDEYDWAQREVFAGTLPPRDQIVLTDTIAGNRAFTFPRFDGKITLNMGLDGFTDPRLYRAGEAGYGAVFIHELTHAWQIYHTRMDINLLAKLFARELCKATGGDPYAITQVNLPFGEYGLEAQAMIVQTWFAEGKDRMDWRFRYIVGNIWVGDPG